MKSLKKHQLFSVDECNKIIDYIEQPTTMWNKTYKPNVFTCTLKKNNQFNLKIRDWISTQFDLTDEKYNDGFEINCFKYFKGSGFPAHIDIIDAWEVNPNYNINVILNNNFSGGNFFLNKILYETNPGYIYKYKSNESHGVTTVTNGIRYMLVCHIFESDLIKRKRTLL